MTTAEIISHLRKRYEAPAWAFLTEVPNGTGAYGTRHADAVAMSLYPSRGLVIHGFEVKASRADWLKELRDPAKAESIAKYCDFWWLVIGDEKIVQPGELPASWGVIAPSGNGLRAKIEPTKLEPKEIGRPFMAALCRRFCEQPKEDMEPVIKARIELALKEAEDRRKRYDPIKTQLEHLQASVAAFEEASGVQIAAWDCGRIGEAVKIVLLNQREDHSTRLQRIRGVAQGIVEEIDRVFPEPEQGRLKL